MKQRIAILLSLLVLVLILIGLNAASYVQQERLPDSEARPNRSTFNVGATGTRALHELLREQGSDVIRWQEPIGEAFESFDATKFSTFVIVGRLQRPFEEEEVQHVLAWVSAGGRLVLIDRDPNPDFLVTTAPWEISVFGGKNSLSSNENEYLTFSVDPASEIQMTAKTEAVRPVQPSLYTEQINGVQPSKFGTSVRLSRSGSAPEKSADDFGSGSGHTQVKGDPVRVDFYDNAPVVHLANADKEMLADFPFGAGRITLLTDPYIVANGGIGLVDNAQLAVNVLTSVRGGIAFDEYHQGYGKDEMQLVAYFSGTPVVAIFLQCVALAALVLFSTGRRFSRPLPAGGSDRLSKLEYVSAMAQLQNRTRAYDLAVENIYTDFRRRVSRFLGVDNFTVSKEQLAALISRRLGNDPQEIYELLASAEDVMHGVPSKKKSVLSVVRRLREIESALGLRRGRK